MGPSWWLWRNQPSLLALVSPVLANISPVLAYLSLVLPFITHLLPRFSGICWRSHSGIAVLSGIACVLPYLTFGGHDFAAVLAYFAKVLSRFPGIQPHFSSLLAHISSGLPGYFASVLSHLSPIHTYLPYLLAS
jgi:hypothetical protein